MWAHMYNTGLFKLHNTAAAEKYWDCPVLNMCAHILTCVITKCLIFENDFNRKINYYETFIMVKYFSKWSENTYECSSIVSWWVLSYLFNPSLPWLVTVWIYPLGLREDHGGWNLFSAKKEPGIQASITRSPTGSCQLHPDY